MVSMARCPLACFGTNGIACGSDTHPPPPTCRPVPPAHPHPCRPNVHAGQVLDEIYSFSTVTHQWKLVQCKPANTGFPLARRSHTCTIAGSTIFLLGGANSLNAPFPSGEVWALETSDWQWRQLPTEWPVPSYFHTTVATRDGRLYVSSVVARRLHCMVCLIPCGVPACEADFLPTACMVATGTRLVA